MCTPCACASGAQELNSLCIGDAFLEWVPRFSKLLPSMLAYRHTLLSLPGGFSRQLQDTLDRQCVQSKLERAGCVFGAPQRRYPDPLWRCAELAAGAWQSDAGASLV